MLTKSTIEWQDFHCVKDLARNVILSACKRRCYLALTSHETLLDANIDLTFCPTMSDYTQLSAQEEESIVYLFNLIREIVARMNNRLPGGLQHDTNFQNYMDWRPKSAGPPTRGRGLMHPVNGEIDDQLFSQRNFHINVVLAAARKIFMKEDRVVKVPSPCFVFGDIHGNMSDLLTFKECFWPMAPGHVGGRYVFLGDYVDRGHQSLEVYLYLIVMKCLYPKQFILLRGNHETRSMHRDFSFQAECERKFGPHLHYQMWENINTVMDVMPICAVIGGKIFCVHGGIPFSCRKLSELEVMPICLKDPESEHDGAWECLWNDPIDNEDFEDVYGELKDLSSEEELARGFLHNKKRGTGQMFSERAVDSFLQANGLQFVIRGHELVKKGFGFKCNGKVITVFSSSAYMRENNVAGVIMVQDGQLKAIQVQTDKRRFQYAK